MRIIFTNDVHGAPSDAADGATFCLRQRLADGDPRGQTYSATQRYTRPALNTRERAFLHLSTSYDREAAVLRWHRDHAPPGKWEWFGIMLNLTVERDCYRFDRATGRVA